MRENEMRTALRARCDELDRRARCVVVGCALGLAALTTTACVEAQPPEAGGADAAVQPAGDGRGADLPAAVAMYSAPGCSWVPPGR